MISCLEKRKSGLEARLCMIKRSATVSSNEHIYNAIIGIVKATTGARHINNFIKMQELVNSNFSRYNSVLANRKLST